MLNILFIESGKFSGGSFESLYQHLRVINREHCRPVVVYLNENHFVDPVKTLGIPVYILTDWLYSKQAPRNIRNVLSYIASFVDSYVPSCYLEFSRLIHIPLINALKHIVQREKIDIIHLNDQVNRDLFGLFVAARMNVTCISHLRSMRSAGFERRRAAYANKIVSLYIANSKATKRHWEAKGIDPKKTKLLYNAIPKTIVEPLDLKLTWEINSHVNTIIGCVGNLNPAKGHRFLLRSFAQLVQSQSGTILLIVGDGPLKAELVNQTRELSIQDAVLFTGYQTMVKEIIAGLDLLVVPSQSEGFGRIILEAMQAKTPVVATKSGGIPEIIEHEYNGILVDYGNEKELSNAMIRLLEDEYLRSKLIKNGYRTVRDRFDLKRYASELEMIYMSVSEDNNMI